MSNWYVGQKVVCVKNGPWVDMLRRGFNIGPIYGEVLTVADIEPAIIGWHDECLVFSRWDGYSFDSKWFRPLDTLDETIERLEADGNALLRELELVEQ